VSRWLDSGPASFTSTDMSTRRVGAVAAGLLLVLSLVIAHGWHQQEQTRALTAEIRRAYGLPPKDVLLPISTLDEVVPEGLSREQVVRRLQPLRGLVVAERWVAGGAADKNSFHAHIIEVRGERGGTYGVAFMYRNDALADIDSPDHLGPITDLPVDSPQARVGTGIP